MGRTYETCVELPYDVSSCYSLYHHAPVPTKRRETFAGTSDIDCVRAENDSQVAPLRERNKVNGDAFHSGHLRFLKDFVNG